MTQITLSVTFAFTLVTDQIPMGEELARHKMGRMDGMAPSWAGATPLLYTVPYPK